MKAAKTLPKTLHGVTLHSMTELSGLHKKKKVGKWEKRLLDLPDNSFFTILVKDRASVYIAAAKHGMTVKTTVLANGRVAVYREDNNK